MKGLAIIWVALAIFMAPFGGRSSKPSHFPDTLLEDISLEIRSGAPLAAGHCFDDALASAVESGEDSSPIEDATEDGFLAEIDCQRLGDLSRGGCSFTRKLVGHCSDLDHRPPRVA